MKNLHLEEPIFRTARRMILAFNAGILGLALTACGGGSSTDAADSSALPVTVSGADKASVSFRAFDSQAARQVTVQVARDATGAPPLDENYTPLGAVYQFTPLGWVEEEIEIRLPLSEEAIANGRPRLLIASPGGEWSDVIDAKREGDFIVARVPNLAYATVASHVGVNRLERSQALAGGSATGAAVTSTAVPNPLNLRFNPATTSPALPAPGSTGLVTVTKNTSLGLEASVLLGSYCTVDTKLSLSATVLRPGSSVVTTVQLGERLFPTHASIASALFDLPLSSSNNGTWKFAATVRCQGPTQGVAPYSANIVGPSMIVNIAANPAAPLITAAPQDIGVTAGNAANFSVTAQGTSLSYAWQRSNDGGATYAPVAGSAASFRLVAVRTDNGALCGVTYAPVACTVASFSFVAALTDNGALFRVKVSNAAGSATSTPARLSVAAKVVLPVVTSDPANKSVVEGQTASFSVAGSGAPAPSIQWQRVAVGAPAGTWVDLAGATSATYITAVTTLAQSGTQYRAVLRNSGGTVASRGATLTVQARVIAPAIVTGPANQNVQEGKSGLFSVTASGTSPLSYQWFKNGVAIVGANATEVLVLALPANVGGSYQITVRISNSAGNVTSAAALMSVAAAPIIGTPIKASTGGVVQGGTGTETDPVLVIPANALGADATISLTTESGSVVGLPAGIVPLGSVIKIGPASLVFITPVTLSLPVPEVFPEGKVLAVIELPAAKATAVNVHTATEQTTQAAQNTAAKATNLRRIAQTSPLGGVTILGVNDPVNVLCANAQSVRGGQHFVDLSRAARFVTAAVSESQCTGSTTKINRALVPSTSTAPCTARDYVASASGLTSLVSRHVHCQTDSYEASITDGTSADTGNYGTFRWEIRSGSHGPAKGLNKTYEFSVRAVRVTPGLNAALPSVRVLLKVTCSSPGKSGTACAHPLTPITVQAVGVGASANAGWSNIGFSTSFDWVGAGNTFAEISQPKVNLASAVGAQILTAGGGADAVNLPSIRCDRGMAVNRADGCVYADAPAVFVLSAADAAVKEAAIHIREAQNAGSPGKLGFAADGSPRVAAFSALQRTRVTGLKGRDNPPAAGANRNYSCVYADSIIKVRPQGSATCPATGGTGCSCDEYPFNSSWNGSFLNTNGTSARHINAVQNGVAGTRLQLFYQAERVLDYTPDPGIAYNIGNEGVSIPARLGGDDFWVHIE